MRSDFDTIFLQSLGWALVHIVWQITLLALLLALLLPRLKSAHHRYWAAFAALFSAFIAFVMTFTWTAVHKFETASTAGLDMAKVRNLFLPGILSPTATADFMERLDSWLEAHTSIVVLCWLLGFAVSLFRLLGGMYYLHRLRRNSSSSAVGRFQEKIGIMARQLGLQRSIELLESALIPSPITLGYFKPIIFFPLGLLNHLAPAEVEAILAHELAHIARRDWLFNLMQAFIETLFYFHPGIWWISAIVRAERENCCDDLAIRITGNRVVLAKALLHLQQLHLPGAVPVLALGAKGRTHFFYRFSLLTRIQRILNQPSPQKSLIMEKFVVAVFLLGMLALVGIRANGSPQLEILRTALSEIPFGWLGDLPQAGIVSNDSVPKPLRRVQKIVREEDGKHVEMEMKDGEVTRLNIDGQEIPANELSQHRALAKDLLRDMPPVPPVPPVPGVPPVPPMPPMPSNDNMSFHFDTPGSIDRLSTTKDGEGNTVIRLEREGKPVEIKVKNGEVWVDGQRVENEASLDLPNGADFGGRFHMDGDGNYLLYQGDFAKDGNFYKNDNADFFTPSMDNFKVEMEMGRAQMLQAQQELKLSDKDRSKHQKEMQKAQKEMQKAEKELQKAHKEMEKQYRLMEKEHQRIQEDRSNMHHRSAQ